MNTNLGKEAICTDRYGDERVLRKTRHGWQLKRDGDSYSDILTPVISKIIGEKIRQIRLSKGLSADELARRVGFSGSKPKGRIYEIEKTPRKYGIRLATLYVIATALECEVIELIPSLQKIKEQSKLNLTEQPIIQYQ